jgi:GAF domain-containing protein
VGTLHLEMDRRTAATTLDDIIAVPSPGLPALDKRAETDVFLALSSTLSRHPERASQHPVDAALTLTAADSAGLTLESDEDGQPVLRWMATAGEFARYLNGTMPRSFSPCGAVLEQRKPLMMQRPARYSPYISEFHAPVCSVLLAPFARHGKLVGTVWVVAHQDEKVFTVEDFAVVQKLATFASAVLDAKRVRH